MGATDFVRLVSAVRVPLGLGAEASEPVSNAGWAEVCRLAAQQNVLPLAMEAYGQTGLRPDVAMLPWVGQSELLQRKLSLNRRVAESLTGVFRAAGLEVMYLKGLTLAPYYGRWGRRVSSDVDYYLYGRAAEGVEALRKAGIETEPYFHHHTHATVEGVLLENHYDFLDLRNHRSNLELDAELKRLASSEGRTRPLEGQAGAYRMTPTMNAVFLMRHMSAHFASETLTLRMLLDWGLFLRAEGGEVDWGLAVRLYGRSGLTGFVSAVQGILEEHLGLGYGIPAVAADGGGTARRVWESVVTPPAPNPFREGTWAHKRHEAGVFLGNRWKHRLVYPGESYARLLLRLAAARMRQGTKH